MRTYYIYIVASSGNSTIYIGITSNLERRSLEHQTKTIEGFTKKYSCNKLVYFEETSDVYDALAREKQLKKWRRAKKDYLIELLNPTWRDLFE